MVDFGFLRVDPKSMVDLVSLGQKSTAMILVS